MANIPPTYYYRPDQEENAFDLFPELEIESSELDNLERMLTGPWMPVSPIGRPSTSPIIDPSNFWARVRLPDEKPQTCFFSTLLDRIYLTSDTDLCVEFNWDHTRFNESTMYVRSTMVFTTQTSKRVEACVQDYHKALANGKSEAIAKHVMLSSRSGTGVYYCGLPNQSDSWFSVLVEFNKTTAEPCHHSYQFVCKNSCASGICRRATNLIFTLEDKWGNVFGRQVMGLRVCASPYRDLKHDEKKHQAGPSARKRRRVSRRPESQNNTRRVQAQRTMTQDTETQPRRMIMLPPLPIVNTKTARAGLFVMRNMTEYVAEHTGGDPQVHENCMNSIKVIDECLADLDETSHS